MNPRFRLVAASIWIIAGRILVADDLDLHKFQEVKNQKETPARIVYLKTDGTEGHEGDAGTVPAIRMDLAPMPKTTFVGIELMAQVDHLVMQDFATAMATKEGRIGLDVWASPDFKRFSNPDPNSKVGDGDWNGHLMTLADMDFWIIGPYHTFFSYLKPSKWTHVEGKFPIANAAHFEFHVPPGSGFIYLKNFFAKP